MTPFNTSNLCDEADYVICSVCCTGCFVIGEKQCEQTFLGIFTFSHNDQGSFHTVRHFTLVYVGTKPLTHPACIA